MWRRSITSVIAAVALTAVGATTAGGAGAAPATQCRVIKGTITIAGEGSPGAETFTGRATGTLAGTLSGISVANDFAGFNIRTTWTFTITDRSGSSAGYVMDVVATNFTSTALVGGGLLTEADPPAGTWSAIHVTLGPQDDSPDGLPPDVFSYVGQRCTESVQ